jgi:hypothetical protein
MPKFRITTKDTKPAFRVELQNGVLMFTLFLVVISTIASFLLMIGALVIPGLARFPLTLIGFITFVIALRINYHLVRDLLGSNTDQEPSVLRPNRVDIHDEFRPSESVPGLDSEKDIVVPMPPKSRRMVKLQITEVGRAEPRVVFDHPED